MPSGEGKKELWRRDHTLRRWAAQAAPLVSSNLAGEVMPMMVTARMIGVMTWAKGVKEKRLLMCKMRIVGVAAILAGAIAVEAGLADARPFAKKQQQFAVGAQYGTNHVYVPAEDMDRFAPSFLPTFGGKSSQSLVVTRPPTPSSTTLQALPKP